MTQKNWWGRNWPWAVPVGGCLTVILLFIFGVGAAIFGVSKVLTGSEPYEFAVEQASTNQEVIAVLGAPVETDGMMQGSLNFQNDRGEVDIRIPIRGPEGKGTIIVIGEKTDGHWQYESLHVIIKETQENINLLEKALESI